jgi:hypothetical protein
MDTIHHGTKMYRNKVTPSSINRKVTGADQMILSVYGPKSGAANPHSENIFP